MHVPRGTVWLTPREFTWAAPQHWQVRGRGTQEPEETWSWAGPMHVQPRPGQVGKLAASGIAMSRVQEYCHWHGRKRADPGAICARQKQNQEKGRASGSEQIQGAFFPRSKTQKRRSGMTGGRGGDERESEPPSKSPRMSIQTHRRHRRKPINVCVHSVRYRLK